MSFWASQMCFISSFTSERVDLPGDEREESVAMAEGYNYIKTLPSKQWAITLPCTLRGPAPTARHPEQDFTCFPEQGLLLPDLFSPTGPLLMPAAAQAASHVLPAHRLGSCGGGMTSHRRHRLQLGILSGQFSLLLDGYSERSHLFREQDQDLYLLSSLSKGRSGCQVTSRTRATWPASV